jgi:hypothetical protein
MAVAKSNTVFQNRQEKRVSYGSNPAHIKKQSV